MTINLIVVLNQATPKESLTFTVRCPARSVVVWCFNGTKLLWIMVTVVEIVVLCVLPLLTAFQMHYGSVKSTSSVLQPNSLLKCIHYAGHFVPIIKTLLGVSHLCVREDNKKSWKVLGAPFLCTDINCCHLYSFKFDLDALCRAFRLLKPRQ